MRSLLSVLALLIVLTFSPRAAQTPAPSFAVEQILGFPSPENLVASPVGSAVAWTFNERGVRNIYVAEGPDFTSRRITSYAEDDRQELTQLSFSDDGKTIVFVRGGDHGSNRQGEVPPNPSGSPVQPRIQIWSVAAAGGSQKVIAAGANPVTAVTSGDMPVDPILQNPGGIGLRWGAGDTLLFMSYRDGFPHLYSLEHPGSAGKPLLLTPGSFMVEQMTLTPDRRFVIYNANTGPDRSDMDRRHLFKVPVNAGTPTPITAGTGIEWAPVVTADGQTIAYLSSGALRPPAPTVVSISGGAPRLLAGERLPADFPASQLVTPELVSFRASDGVEAHGQLFKPIGGATRKPAIVYVHGGGPRQMMLGWHNRWEYANDYGANQYLVSRGFIVLSVDYRLSVGYGQAFQFAENTGPRGAAEYRDILAGGKYLQSRPDVDPSRIGIWGASLGGYLTALALGRNSDVFAAGVDIHGVHDRLPPVNAAQLAHAIVGDGITEADLRQALKVEYESSPIAAVSTWKSPVLLIHGDDDRTVDFHQTVDLERRLLAKGVNVEELVLPDDVHDSLLWRHWKTSITALAEFFERTLKTKR